MVGSQGTRCSFGRRPLLGRWTLLEHHSYPNLISIFPLQDTPIYLAFDVLLPAPTPGYIYGLPLRWILHPFT